MTIESHGIAEQEYVLGTGDDEVARLGLQHRVWRPRATDAWRRAGFTAGQTIIDVGSGPGPAAIDLAELVGSSGRVIALDKSRRFLDALEATGRARGLHQIETRELDLDGDGFSVARVAGALAPGGALVVHEYFDYATWRLAPRCPEVEEFVAAVMESWRAQGGEPNVGLLLPGWLEELGFEIKSLLPIIDLVTTRNHVWQWPAAFLRSGIHRLIDLGHLTIERGAAIRDAFEAAAAEPSTRMITPAVVEIIATLRR
jgi:SAM-dependent methyltransferase